MEQEQTPNKPFEGFIYKDHYEKFQEVSQKMKDAAWQVFAPKNEINMEQETKQLSLNERILDCIDEGHVADSHLSGYDEKKAAKAIEQLIISEKIDLLNELRKEIFLAGSISHYRKIDEKIQLLTEKLNILK